MWKVYQNNTFEIKYKLSKRITTITFLYYINKKLLLKCNGYYPFLSFKIFKKTSEFEAEMQIIKRKKDNSKDKKRMNRIFSILHFLDMEVATNPNNTNTFPNILTLHIYKSILLFIIIQFLVKDISKITENINLDKKQL